MNVRSYSLSLARNRGFTLAEGVIALAVLSLFVMACFSSIMFSRVTATKAKQQAIVTDFLVHYSELVRGLPFNEVQTGRAINPLLDGSDDAPNIIIPTDGNWVPLSTDDYEAFHPDLMWISHLAPRMRATLTTDTVAGEEHTKHLNVQVQWNAPLGRGDHLEQEVDLIRVKDL